MGGICALDHARKRKGWDGVVDVAGVAPSERHVKGTTMPEKELFDLEENAGRRSLRQMARSFEVTEPWRTIRNPIVGDEVTFLRTAQETGEEYVLARVKLAPGGGNPLHHHPTFAEEFEVVEGSLTIERDGRKLLLDPGEHATVPAGSVHRFANDTDHPIVFLAQIRPARRFEEVLRVAYGLARDGKTNAAGIPKNPLELALLYEMGESYLADVPLWLQRTISILLAGLARRLGVERSLDKYLVPDEA